jgi:hypothetical protein
MRNFIIFISLISTLSLFSQSENGERVLSAKCAIQQTMGGAGYWQVSITNFSDPGGQVDATAIDTFDYVQFSDSGNPYALQVVGVIFAVGNTATVKLSNVGITGISSVPTTSNATWSKRTENFGLTPWPANITANDAQLNQEYTMYKIDSILGAFSAGSDIDYITTDSFSTFIGGYTFASIPTNKTILRTTTGSVYQKTSTSFVTERTVGNGLLANTKLTQAGTTLVWNSNLNNRVGLNTGANSSVTITNPSNLTSQTFGETFVVQVSTSTIPVTVVFDTVYSKFDFTAFGSVNLAAFTEATYSFRVIKSGNKGFKLACTDDLGGGGSTTDSLYRAANASMLKNATLASKWKIGRVVVTDGYYAAGDGGGANYILEAGVGNDTSSFTVPGIGRARLIPNADGSLSPLQVGAKKNDGLNDRPRIQHLISFHRYIKDLGDGEYTVGKSLIVRDSLTLEFGRNTRLKRTGSQDNMLATEGQFAPTGTTKAVTIRGGIWDANGVGASGGPHATSDYALMFFNTEDFIVEDLKVINAAKYCINFGNWHNAIVRNIDVHSLSDAVHMTGPGNVGLIENITGTSGDDYVVLAGSNYTANIVTEGNIEHVIINNIRPDTAAGHVVAIFPGNLGGSISSLFHVEDVIINNVSGYATNPIVAITEYGTSYTDPVAGPSYGGVVKNVKISNVDAWSDIGAILSIKMDSVENVSLENVSVRNNNADVVSIARGYITNLYIDNLHHYGSNIAGYRSINLQTNANVRSLSISNSTFRAAGNTPFINWSQTTKGGLLTLDNNTFTGLATLQGKVSINSDSVEVKCSNSTFINSYTSFELNGLGERLYIDDTNFDKVTHCAITAGTATASIWPISYRHDGNKANTFRNLGSGSLELREVNPSQYDFITTSSAYAISNFHPTGYAFFLKNTHATNAIPISTSGETINGASSVNLDAGLGVRILKTGATTWITSTSPTIPAASKWTDGSGFIYRNTPVSINRSTRDAGAALDVNGIIYANGSSISSGIIVDAAGSKRFGIISESPNLPQIRHTGNLSVLHCPSGDVTNTTSATEGFRITSTDVQAYKPFKIFNSLTAQSGSRTGTGTKIAGWDVNDKSTDITIGSNLVLTSGMLNASFTLANAILNMNGFPINNISRVSADSSNILNPSFENSPTFNYQDYTTTGTLNRELAHYWDGTTDDTLTVNAVLPDETPFFVKNKDGLLLVTILPGSGQTMSGDGRIYPGEGVWFQRHGTVIERITPFRKDYYASLSPTTNGTGEFTVTHNLGTTSVITTAQAVCDACNYVIHRKSTGGITSTTATFVVRDSTTGLTVSGTSMSVDVSVIRTQ